jgi:hypothetical protein
MSGLNAFDRVMGVLASKLIGNGRHITIQQNTDRLKEIHDQTHNSTPIVNSQGFEGRKQCILRSLKENTKC